MSDLIKTQDYKDFIESIKSKVQQAQIRVHVKVCIELHELYWDIAQEIVEKQNNSKWGEGVLTHISADLRQAFPDTKGFSVTNIKYMRNWYLFYHSELRPQAVDLLAKSDKTNDVVENQWFSNRPQAVDDLFKIPWGHNREIITKCSSVPEALFYVRGATEYGWSRSVLVHQIESGLYQREGKAITNFKRTLPAPDSDLAQATTKDPYNFDFLTLTENYNERELEHALVDHVTKFLLELGAGFAYMGKQVALKVGDSDFYLDLLFYHTTLHCHVVVELKTVEFQPEFAGKLNFYCSAVDTQRRSEKDGPTIGMLICKGRDKTVVEYALKDMTKPIGVSEYRLTESFPEEWKGSLPSIEEIEYEFEASK